MGQVRLLPLLAIAAICLFGLKISGLLFSNGYMFTGSAPASAQDSKPKTEEPAKPEKAADVPEKPAKEPAKKAVEKAGKPEADPSNTDTAEAVGPGAAPAGATTAVLTSLSERRKELDKQARDLAMRENLLKAVEQRVETRITELKAIEQRIETELKKRDDARDEEYAKLVTLYSKMKPKDAARIFNRLDIAVLTDLVRRMKPRTISPIFAAMEPAVAERVTMELAIRDEQQAPRTDALPKIASETPG